MNTYYLIIVAFLVYVLLATVCCKLMVGVFYPVVVARYGVENVKIAACDVIGKTYGHAYLIVRGAPYEPRFLGLYLLSHIDYAHPLKTWDDLQAFTDEYSLTPFK